MPQYPNRQFLEFEQPIKELYEHIEENKRLAEKNAKADYKSIIQQMEDSIVDKRKEITEQLTPWQRVQLSRHPDRPYTLKYIDVLTDGLGIQALKVWSAVVRFEGLKKVNPKK